MCWLCFGPSSSEVLPTDSQAHSGQEGHPPPQPCTQQPPSQTHSRSHSFLPASPSPQLCPGLVSTGCQWPRSHTHNPWVMADKRRCCCWEPGWGQPGQPGRAGEKEKLPLLLLLPHFIPTGDDLQLSPC